MYGRDGSRTGGPSALGLAAEVGSGLRPVAATAAHAQVPVVVGSALGYGHDGVDLERIPGGGRRAAVGAPVPGPFERPPTLRRGGRGERRRGRDPGRLVPGAVAALPELAAAKTRRRRHSSNVATSVPAI